MSCYRSSAIKQKNIRIQSNEIDTPTSVVIKTNPLFTQSSPIDHQEKLGAIESFGEEEFPGYHKVYCDPTRGRQRKKTKDYEMISAIMELAKYGILNMTVITCLLATLLIEDAFKFVQGRNNIAKRNPNMCSQR